MQIISKRERRESVARYLVFPSLTIPGASLSFPCDAAGNVDLGSLQPSAVENFAIARFGTEYGPGIVEEYRNAYNVPAVGRCSSCGSNVTLDSSWANECPCCGLEYNGAGQLLAPRRFWGEETGESF